MNILHNKKGGFFEDMSIGQILLMVIVLLLLGGFIYYMLTGVNNAAGHGLSTIFSFLK